MLLALTGYETALLVVAAVFIVFALTVALVIPRSRPEFPSRRLGVFVVVCVAFFAAQLTAVLVLAEVGEADEQVAHEETTEPETTDTETTPTDATPTETTETTETTSTEHYDDGRDEGRSGRRQGGVRLRGMCQLSHAGGRRGDRDDRPQPGRGVAFRRQGRRTGDERRRRDAVFQGHAERAADPGRRCLRLVGCRKLTPRSSPLGCSSLERCPSGRRSATGNRVRAERCVAGSNPALSARFRWGRTGGV